MLFNNLLIINFKYGLWFPSHVYYITFINTYLNISSTGWWNNTSYYVNIYVIYIYTYDTSYWCQNDRQDVDIGTACNRLNVSNMAAFLWGGRGPPRDPSLCEAIRAVSCQSEYNIVTTSLLREKANSHVYIDIHHI